ncbi:MAG: hypothetical protein AVDCRST_MAG13-2244 [uncultured Solirubrobacteraceae bacterium]|uniref:Uncharacterized protein n=1 Tax=uncultured Solirubrobacteraceae bacterium TaxID=1162706 RepID=A0A6J4SJB6_9ACTN|nr:MAG: hypothetical protein AVDCRST_MAG13-2244 [uncultured Solirubrobacteraceae bacterium]
MQRGEHAPGAVEDARDAAGVQPRVDPAELHGPGHAQPLAERGAADVRLGEQERVAGDHAGADGEAVALAGLHGQAQAGEPRQARAPGARGQHDRVGLHVPRGRPDPADRAAVRLEAEDLGALEDLGARAAQPGAEAGDERGRQDVPVLPDAQSRAGPRAQGGLGLAQLGSLEDPGGKVVAQVPHGLQAGQEPPGGVGLAGGHEEPLLVQLHGHAVGPHRVHEPEDPPAELRERPHAGGVVAGVAAQGEAQEPRQHPRQLGGGEVQRRAPVDERAQAVGGQPGLGERPGLRRREPARVARGRRAADPVALHHGDAGPGAAQGVRAAQAGDPAADDRHVGAGGGRRGAGHGGHRRRKMPSRGRLRVLPAGPGARPAARLGAGRRPPLPARHGERGAGRAHRPGARARRAQRPRVGARAPDAGSRLRGGPARRPHRGLPRAPARGGPGRAVGRRACPGRAGDVGRGAPHRRGRPRGGRRRPGRPAGAGPRPRASRGPPRRAGPRLRLDVPQQRRAGGRARPAPRRRARRDPRLGRARRQRRGADLLGPRGRPGHLPAPAGLVSRARRRPARDGRPVGGGLHGERPAASRHHGRGLPAGLRRARRPGGPALRARPAARRGRPGPVRPGPDGADARLRGGLPGAGRARGAPGRRGGGRTPGGLHGGRLQPRLQPVLSARGARGARGELRRHPRPMARRPGGAGRGGARRRPGARGDRGRPPGPDALVLSAARRQKRSQRTLAVPLTQRTRV